MTVEFDCVCPIAQMQGEDAEETGELRVMYERAREYLLSRSWQPAVDNSFFGFGVGGVIAVFLFHARAPAIGVDDWFWVVEGDLPSAYLVTDRASTPAAAIAVYCELMQDWIEAVRSGDSLDDVFPVDGPPDEEHARMLESRIRLLRSDFVPSASED